MIKTLLISAYVAHKIWWKRQNKVRAVRFSAFMKGRM
jgi:hypothetical protein